MGKGVLLRGSCERSALMFLPLQRERGVERKKSPEARDCRKQIIRSSSASVSQETCTHVDLTRNLYAADFSPSLPPPQPRPPRRVRVAAEENHYHICGVRLRTSRRLFGLSASRVGTKCKAAARLVGGQTEVGRGERNGGIDRLCLFIDVYLLAFTRLITL